MHSHGKQVHILRFALPSSLFVPISCSVVIIKVRISKDVVTCLLSYSNTSCVIITILCCSEPV